MRSDALGERQKLIPEFVSEIDKCRDTNESPFTIKVKTSASFKHLEKFIEDEKLQYLSNENADHSIPTSHPCDGFILDIVTDKIIVGTNPNSLKWKPPKLSTIDFEVRVCEDPHMVHLCVQTNDGIKILYEQKTSETVRFPYTLPYPYDDFENSDKSGSQETKKINVEFFDHKIVEMERCRKTKIWFFTSSDKLRSDKTTPNYITTAMDVISSLDDDITMEELIALSKRAH